MAPTRREDCRGVRASVRVARELVSQGRSESRCSTLVYAQVERIIEHLNFLLDLEKRES